jgi:hypothetical protein
MKLSSGNQPILLQCDGRLLPMIKNMAGYALGSGVISAADIEKMVSTIEQAVSDRSYLALAPQFVVTATR